MSNPSEERKSKYIPKVGIGIAAYGHQSPIWWKPVMDTVGTWWKEGIEFDRVYWSGVSNTDVNRNNIVHEWREEGKSEWLLWVDGDNPTPIGAIKRLLSLQKPVVSGVYYGGSIDQEMLPIAYIRNDNGSYNSVAKMRQWEKGELLQVDAVGMGCMLTHRSVYDKIEEDFGMYQRYSGGLIALKKDQIHGEIKDIPPGHPYQQQVRKGIYYEPIIKVQHKIKKFPFFMCQFVRTEDFHFCELVRDSHEIWLDTSVEVSHVKDHPWSGQHYRFANGLRPDPTPQEAEIV